MSWNMGDIFDALGEAIRAANPALAQGDRLYTWGDFTRRTNNLGAQLVARGARPEDKVALYLRNCPEYMETTVACMKARLVHVNVNFRYREDEIQYLLDQPGAQTAVVR